MQKRIEMVDPLRAAENAGAVLRAAWKPPCLHYSTEYLKWQFAFPGVLPPAVVTAYDGDTAVGCAAVTPRRFIFAGTHVYAYVLSFVAVHPSAQGHGIAGGLYETLLDTIPQSTPVVAFAQPESKGEALLLRSFNRASFQHKQLRSCRATARLPRPGDDSSQVCATDGLDFVEYDSTFSGTDPTILWNAPSAEQWEHYLADPRGRSFMIVRDSGGASIGAAMAVCAEIVSNDGVQQVPMLESVCLSRSSADGLRAAFAHAQLKGPAHAAVMASNLSQFDEALPRAAGARALPSIFHAYLFTRGAPMLPASAVNIEVT
jgi:GNAT superfamily N-acetyltransferase